MMSVRDNKKCNISIFVVLSMLIVLSLAGCGKKNDKPDESAYNGTLVFTYGDNYVTKGEVYIYYNTICERYESQYGKEVWEREISNGKDESITMDEAVREETIKEIVKVKTLVSQSDSFRVFLTEAEEAELRQNAKDIYKGFTDEDIAKMELDEDVIYRVLSETELAGRVEERLLIDNPIEVSDEDARMTTFYDMYFNCYRMGSNDNIVPFSEEERKIQYENALTACSTLATANIDENKDAENIAKLAEYYKLSEAGEYTMSPDDIMEVYGEDVYDLLYSMKAGDYSTVIETEYGYHVFQMISLTDPKATKAKKEAMTIQKIDAQLATNLAKWQKKIDSDFKYPESIDMDVYNTIKRD